MTRLYLLKRKNGKLVRVFTRKPYEAELQDMYEPVKLIWSGESENYYRYDGDKIELWILKNNKYEFKKATN